MNSKILLLIMPIILFLTLALSSILNDYLNDKNKIEDIKKVEGKIKELTFIDEIIEQLQIERGLSAIYYNNRSNKILTKLTKQRKKTDLVLKNNFQLFDSEQINIQRKEVIKNIQNKEFSNFEIFMHYTKIISKLSLQAESLIITTENSKIKNSLIYYNHLNIMQESLAQLRGLISGIFASKNITKEEYNEIVILNRIFNRHHQRVSSNSTLKFSLQNSCIEKTLFTINSIEKESLQTIDEQPLKWFHIATCSVNIIRKNVLTEMININQVVKDSKNSAQNIANIHIILWFLGALFLFVTLYISYKLSSKLIREQKLLNSYKDVIDNNTHSIVSKTDKHGIITYVNDTFCKVSKYEREDLINKPHNAVRHEDVPKEVFKELWSTIQAGKTWDGIVKNRCKNGDAYWVHASISPICDDKGNLVEYIALRHDLTDMFLLQEESENTQKELIYRLGEAVESRSKESGNHVKRVAHYSKKLAELKGLSNNEMELIFIASTMHDIGKIAIPDDILLKKGKLNNNEFTIMKTHTQIGYKLLSGSNLPILKMASEIAYQHHESYDGKGYPLGLKKDEISIAAKIVSIVDTFDALNSVRVYKEAWKIEDVLKTVRSESGKKFDPELTKLFLDNIDEFILIKNRLKDSI